jgi:UPF0271 protein
MASLLNCDMGESFGLYKLGDDAGLMPLIDVANVACGFHASDFNHMRATVRLAKQHAVAVGAHPSLPDRQGFGRREIAMKREELANCLIYQIGALKGFLEAEGMVLNHIKPHGSLFGMAGRLPHIAEAICDVADIFKVPVFGMLGTLHETIYPARGASLVAEYYADLEYDDEGRRVRAIREGLTKTVGGRDVRVGAETICVHSDTPNAVEIARAVRAAIRGLEA